MKRRILTGSTQKNKDSFKTAMVYLFGANKGFESLINFCQASPEDVNSEQSMPLVYVNALLDSIMEIVPNFQNEEKKEELIAEIK